MTCRQCGDPCQMDRHWPRCPSCLITYDTHSGSAYDSNWRDVTWAAEVTPS